MVLRWRRALFVPPVVVVLVSCGGSGPSTATPTPSPTTGPTHTGTPNAEAGLPAAAVLADAQHALATARSFHVAGMVTDGVTVDSDVVGHDVHGTVTYGTHTWEYLVRGGTTWFRGRELWASTQSPDVAARLGDHWVHVDTATGYWTLSGYLPHTGDVMITDVYGPHAGLVNQGVSTVDGRSVVTIANATDLYTVTAVGPPYPLRWTDLKEPSCGTVISSIDAPLVIPFATDALDLTTEGGSVAPLPTPTPAH